MSADMGSHPVNLAFRFLLELAALLAMGLWGWKQGEGGIRVLIALAVPAVAAALWGTLAVPGDPSRSGSAPLAVSGVLRLAIELSFFAFATWALYKVQGTNLSVLLGVAVIIHYALSYDRVMWLIER
jgi:hypothetical protein